MTQDELRAMVHYDPSTGAFTWIKSRGRAKAGSIAGSTNLDGYIIVGGKYAHRLAFIYMTGSCPALVDHIDQNKGNNRWANLRAATKSVNALNSTLAANPNEFRGVSWHRDGRKWQAHCGREYLGLFETQAAAHAAYLAAAGEKLCLAM